ncbi:Zinc transporter 2 [Frankliniella fusca]|uniref:Zinc transporter 2 n=1 Tax=Frankliniella fusca TaxID=407009 RepID=A0AAE1HYT3_9NEOP|nr:Zinc transporter 2 [Frankliniella fusca]
MSHLNSNLPDSLDVRLGSRSSDDSLILDESNTGEIWNDSELECPTFQVNYIASNLNGHSSNEGLRREWFKEPWNGLASKQAISGEPLHFNANGSIPPRLSLSGEESEVPLLSTESWLPSGFEGDVDHCHPHPDAATNNLAWRRLLSATFLCLFFMIAEIVGGHFAGSTAIMADAAHLLSDLVGLLVSLLAIWLGQRPPTKILSFGFHRAEVLGALFSIFVIWILTGIFVYIAILRLVHDTIDVRADRMMAVAAGGIVINIIMGVVLHGGCQQIGGQHSHGFGHHGHSHNHNESGVNQISPCLANSNVNHSEEEHLGVLNVGGKRTNINVRAAAIHVVGDLIQSIGVFIAAVVIKFNPAAKIADPICTFLFAIVVLATTVPLLKDAGFILLEGFPQTISYSKVLSVLRDIPGVRHVHSLHVWSLTAGKHASAVHLAVDSSIDRDVVTSKARDILQTKFGILFSTIQTERFDPFTMNSCFQCKPPAS